MARLVVPRGMPSLASPLDESAFMLLATGGWPHRAPGAWAYELKVDGFRTMATTGTTGPRLLSRNGNEMGDRFPEVMQSLRSLSWDAVIDGELAVLDAEGRPDWHRVRRRSALKRATAIAPAAAMEPATVFAFDLLAYRGRDLRALPYEHRKALLRDLVPPGLAHVQYVEPFADAEELWEVVLAHRLEGIVAKRIGSQYVSGRSNDWVKLRAPTARPQERRGP